MQIHPEQNDIIVPEILLNEDRNKSVSPRGGKYDFRHNPNPNYSEDFRYEKRLIFVQK